MKFVVDEMPTRESNCPFSKWTPNPPFIEEPGYWNCTFGVTDKHNYSSCTLGEQENQCRWLIQSQSQVY